MRDEETLQERLENSRPVDEGWTNQVYETSEGTIIKVFSNHFIETPIFALTDLLHGKINYPSKKERMQKEKDSKKFLKSNDYAAPAVLNEYSNALEMEKISGESLRTRLQDLDSEQTFQIGLKIGELIAELHSKDFSIGDATFENFYLSEDRIYSIDHEYSSLNSDFIDKERDIIHVISDAIEEKPDTYRKFREGFETGYREANKIELLAAFAFSNLTSILSVELGKTRNSFRNLLKI